MDLERAYFTETSYFFIFSPSVFLSAISLGPPLKPMKWQDKMSPVILLSELRFRRGLPSRSRFLIRVLPHPLDAVLGEPPALCGRGLSKHLS